MSFNSHRRNLSLVTASNVGSKLRHRSLHKINPPTPQNWLLLSAKQHYSQQNNMETAAKQFQMYLSHNPNHLESLYLCAIAYMHLQEYHKAIQKLIQILSLRKTSRRMIINANIPSNCKVLLLLGIAFMKIKNYERALSSANQVISSDSKFTEGYCFRAKLYFKTGQYQKGYNDYVNALKCDPRCLAAIMGLGDYYCNNIGNYAQAIKYFEKAKQILEGLGTINDQIYPNNTLLANIEKKNNNRLTKSLKKQKINHGVDAENSWKLMNESTEDLVNEIQLKYSICLYYTQKYVEAINHLNFLLSNGLKKGSQYYYFLGMSQYQLSQEQYQRNNSIKELKPEIYLRQAILNLQFSIKLKTNKKIMTKAAKNLIKIYIQHYQFYEACNIVQLAINNNIEIKEERELCEVCMLVIKHKYEKSLIRLKNLYENIMNSQKSINKNKDKKSEKKQLKTNSNRVNDYNLTHSVHQREIQDLNNIQAQSPVRDYWSGRNNLISKSHYYKVKPETQMLPQTVNQFEWMKPILLLFRTYTEFFSDNFIECLQSFEIYENYIKDYLGKDPQNDIYLSYNKVLCQAILMIDNEMIEESFEKLTICLDNYHRFTNTITVQPILFKIIGLIRLSQSQNPYLSAQINTQSKILDHALQVFNHYRPTLTHNHLSKYYQGLILLMKQDYQQANQILESCLKNIDECLWGFLYVKGIVQMHRANYKDAIKQFSAGLLLEEKPDLYLGRCISYILFYQQSVQKNSLLIEKSFEDLQKFIQLQDDKQKISIWVTKILFFNKAYEEAYKSMQKISVSQKEQDEDLEKIQKLLNVFDGTFEEGGILGRILMNAFEGKYEPNSLIINDTRHEIIESDFFPAQYRKWVEILNLYSQEKYVELIKLLQREIFEAKDKQSELIQLKYNLFVVFMLVGDAIKAKNVLSSLGKHEQFQTRVNKIINNQFEIDQCFDDLQAEFKSSKRLSSFLNYRKAEIEVQAGKLRWIFIKISLPFPCFPKPNILLTVEREFIIKETAQSCIPKKIEAPWIRKVTGMIQFTDAIVESMQNSVFIEFQQDDFLAEDSLNQSNTNQHRIQE